MPSRRDLILLEKVSREVGEPEKKGDMSNEAQGNQEYGEREMQNSNMQRMAPNAMLGVEGAQYVETQMEQGRVMGNEEGGGGGVAGEGNQGMDHWAGDGMFAHITRPQLADPTVKTECLRAFWKYQSEQVQQMTLPRVQTLPPKRIRRIIKYDEDVVVRMALYSPFSDERDKCEHID